MVVLYEATKQSCSHYTERYLLRARWVLYRTVLSLLFVSNRAFIWYEELKFCLQNRESPSRWKSYQVVHLYKQKEERVLCEKKLVNKPEIHQSMETNIKKCLQ